LGKLLNFANNWWGGEGPVKHHSTFKACPPRGFGPRSKIRKGVSTKCKHVFGKHERTRPQKKDSSKNKKTNAKTPKETRKRQNSNAGK